MGKTSFLI